MVEEEMCKSCLQFQSMRESNYNGILIKLLLGTASSLWNLQPWSGFMFTALQNIMWCWLMTWAAFLLPFFYLPFDYYFFLKSLYLQRTRLYLLPWRCWYHCYSAGLKLGIRSKCMCKTTNHHHPPCKSVSRKSIWLGHLSGWLEWADVSSSKPSWWVMRTTETLKSRFGAK